MDTVKQDLFRHKKHSIPIEVLIKIAYKFIFWQGIKLYNDPHE